MDRNHAIAKCEIIGSMAVFGTIAFFVRNIALPSGELALCMAVIAAVTLLIYQLFTKSLIRGGHQTGAASFVFLRGGHGHQLDSVLPGI